MNKASLYASMLLGITTSLVVLSGCSKSGDSQVPCSDGTTNHDFVYHAKEEKEETYGFDAYYDCSKCSKLFDLNHKNIQTKPIIAPTRKILLPNKFNGSNVDTVDEDVNAYLAKSTEKEIASYLKVNEGNTNCVTTGVNLSWSKSGCGNTFSIEISKDENFVTKERTINNVSDTYLTVYNLVPGKHYYRIKDNYGNYSKTDNFVISNSLFTIKSEDTTGVRNMRDIATFATTTGDVMKYGLLYRSALPSSNDLNVFYWDLGIKTEMDLRIKGGQNDEIGSFTGIGQGLINYVHPVPENAQFWPQYDQIFQPQYLSYTKSYFQNVFTVLADKNNYPVVFHCKSGADRTGTLAYFLQGLSGVSYENLTKDYELTSFYRSPRWRSDIIKDGNDYVFDPCGYMQETGRWGIFHQTMMTNYGEGRTLPQTLLYFLTSYCEVNPNLIKNTLSNILEGENYLSLFQ